MGILLQTERLVLRQFTAGDVEHLHHLHNEPDVMQFLNGGKPTPYAIIERETLPQFLAYYERYAGYG